MQFTIKTKELQKALGDVKKAVPSSPHNPVLKGFQLICTTDALSVTGTNLDLSIQSCIPTHKDNVEVLAVERPGGIVTSHLLEDIAKKLQSEDVTIAVNEQNSISISSGRAKFSLNGISIEEFPKVEFLTESPVMSMKTSELKTMVEKVAFAASTSENRPILTGVHMANQDGKIVVQSTDSHRLTKKILDSETEQNFNIVIPKDSLQNLVKLLTNDNAMVEIFITDKNIQFKFDNTSVISRLLEGNFPVTDRLIPEEFTTTFTVNKKEFSGAVDRTTILSENKKDTVSFNVTHDSVGIASKQNEIGNVKEVIIPENFTGDDIKITLNGQFLKDALKAAKGDTVTFGFNGAMKPVRLDESGDDNYLQLVLPVRTY